MAWSPQQRSTLQDALARRCPDNVALRALVVRLDLFDLLGRLDISDADSVLPDVLIYLEALDLVDVAWLRDNVGPPDAHPDLFRAFGHTPQPAEPAAEPAAEVKQAEKKPRPEPEVGRDGAEQRRGASGEGAQGASHSISTE